MLLGIPSGKAMRDGTTVPTLQSVCSVPCWRRKDRARLSMPIRDTKVDECLCGVGSVCDEIRALRDEGLR